MSEVSKKDYRNMSTEIRTLILDRGTMDYFCFGDESKEALVVLPGLSLKSVMGSADAIVSAYAPMAEEYHVYFFDRIHEFPKGYDIAAMAEDTLEAFEKAGIEKAHIMGVSQGGMIALLMALKKPEAIRSLLLCSSASRIPESSKAGFEAWKKLAEQRDPKKLSEAFGQMVYSPSFYAKYKELIIAASQGAAESDFTNFIISLEGTADFDVFDRLNEIKCPVSVIAAGEDRVLGVQSSLEIVRKLGCASYIYEGYGHGVYDEAPDYLEHVKAFLADARQKE